MQAAHKIHLINQVLNIIKSEKIGSKTTQWQINSVRRTRCGFDRKTCDSLKHLLLRVRRCLIRTLIRKECDGTDDTPEWHFHSRKQLKYGGDKWCAEFSNNRRPASTTWPWSIRPSLAVLWGVCWMFYPQQGGQHQQRPQQYGWATFGFSEPTSTGEDLQQLSPGTYCVAMRISRTWGS